MLYQDKCNLTKKENIFFVKRHFSSVIYTGLKMENRNITFPQTEIILNGVNDGDVRLDDIYAILGMKRALEIFFKSIDSPFCPDFLKEFNYHIAKDEAIESGVLRNGSVSISGTDYTPPIPNDKQFNENIKKILLANKSNTEMALDLFLHLIYKQYFWDGNKRTALIGANFILCQKGCGLLEISDKNMKNFAILLNRMFNTGKFDELKIFLYENCITCMEINRTNEQNYER